MRYDNEVKKVKSLVDSDVWDMLKAYNVFIAGGAITSMFTSREVNDIDVYFRNKSDFVNFIVEAFNGDFNLVCKNMTSKSVLFIDKHTEAKVQCIIYRFFETVEEIFNDFDFTCCMGALDTSTEEIVLHPDFLKHNAQRYISFNSGTAYPIVSLMRVQKYVEKGYTISRPQMLRIIMRCMELDITSWEQLEDHLGGMYGLQFDEVFDKSQSFSLSTAIDKLANLESCHTKFSNKQYGRNDILKQVVDVGTDDAEGRYFKWVEEEDTGKFCSIYRDTYKYVLGEHRTEFPERHNGVWVLTAQEMLDHPNSNSYGNKIIEIIPDKELSYLRVGIVEGSYKVGERRWTIGEFIQEFNCLED